MHHFYYSLFDFYRSFSLIYIQSTCSKMIKISKLILKSVSSNDSPKDGQFTPRESG